MSNAPGTSAHLTDETFEALLLGELSAEDRASISAHLEMCAECREAFGDPDLMWASLPFAALEADVAYDPAAAWAGIASRLNEVADAPERDPEPATIAATAIPQSPARPVRLSDRRRVTWLMAASIAGVTLLLGVVLGQLLPNWQDGGGQQTIAVKIENPNLQASAVLTYLPDQQVFVLEVSGMPPAPEGYVYQAWLIDAEGPVPSGVMGSGQNQLATHGDKAQFSTFAITLEPGPLGVPAPTSDPILVANLSGS